MEFLSYFGVDSKTKIYILAISFFPIVVVLLSYFWPRSIDAFKDFVFYVASGVVDPFFVRKEESPEISKLNQDIKALRDGNDELLKHLKLYSIVGPPKPFATIDETISSSQNNDLAISDDDDFDDVVEKALIKKVVSGGEGLALADLLKIRDAANEEAKKRARGMSLQRTVEQQLDSASSIKRAMINLFVAVSILITTMMVFKIGFVDADLQKVILGLYVSLATFIVYVYRSSNARALVLLAIKEDSKKYHDVEKFIQRLKPYASPTDRDVDVIKLLLLNRAEREKNSEHPYELVLKGVSNSNILLKGGKVLESIGKNK
ncbi:hypothetical protein OX462_02465 [Janthinobacterium sp. SUN098]|uniref:hypothetical protein n=1 Tax=Janthinobacterium sp. SUN098 TaxID=3002437 RepID=UPI0038D49301